MRNALIEGPWREIPEPDAGLLLARFREAWSGMMLSGAHPEEMGLIPQKMRAMPLSCYTRTLLCEAEIVDPPKAVRLAAFLFGPFGIRLIDGNSAFVHDLNQDFGILLDTEERAAAYGRFFCSAVHGDQGRFELLEHPGQLQAWIVSPENLARVKPVAVEGDGDFWRLSGTVRYGDAVFAAVFRMQRDGLVEMVDDESLELLEGAAVETFDFPFRIVPCPPDREAQ